MRIPTTIDVLTRSIVCACATFSFSRFSFFFPSPPASLFHPLRSVTNTQSRRCPYRKSPTHRGGRCACLAAWATPPNRVSSADQLTEKCTVHLHLQGEPRITIHLWKFHRPVSDTLHESRSNAWNFHSAANYVGRAISIFNVHSMPRWSFRHELNLRLRVERANEEWRK